MPESLLKRTLELLRADKRPMRSIAAGSGLGYHWLVKLKQDQIPNPGILHIEQLYKFLETPTDA